jgi:hypothetical protein
VRFSDEKVGRFAPEKRIDGVEAVLFAGGICAHVELAVEAVGDVLWIGIEERSRCFGGTNREMRA